MRILIVEDSKTDRDLLHYILEERFHRDAEFPMAENLKTAFAYLDQGNTDCVILDLNLPDSAGKETFEKISERYPEVPILVMTNNKDRELAISMIQKGAADYIIKDFTDGEDIFRRVLFAIEKHRTTVRVLPEEAASVHRLDRAQAQLRTAHRSGQHHAVPHLTVEATSAVAEISKRMFAEVQKISTKIERQAIQTEHIGTIVQDLKNDIRGTGNRPSMSSQLNLLNHRLGEVEEKLDKDEDRASQIEIIEHTTATQIQTTRMTNRTKIIVAIIGFVGLIVTGVVTYHVAINQLEKGFTEGPK